MASSDTCQTKLVYQAQPDGSVVFAPEHRALWVAAIWAAIDSAATWADLAARLPGHELEQVLWMGFDQQGECRPEPADPFSTDVLPGFCDGDYPPWLATEMAACLSTEFCETFGTRVDTVLNGSVWRFTALKLPEMTSQLQDYGWQLSEARGYVLR